MIVLLFYGSYNWFLERILGASFSFECASFEFLKVRNLNNVLQQGRIVNEIEIKHTKNGK